MAVRSASGSGRRRTSGSFPSDKLGRMVRYESAAACALLFFLEYDLDVDTYLERPFALTDVGANGRLVSYTPTFLVVHAAYRELVECATVLPDAAAERQPAWEIGRAWAAAHHHRFRVVTADELRAGARLDNLRILWRYRAFRPPPMLTAQCLTLLAGQPRGLPFGALTDRLAASGVGDRGAAVACVYHLLWRQALLADLDRPLDDGTVIWRATAQRSGSGKG